MEFEKCFLIYCYKIFEKMNFLALYMILLKSMFMYFIYS